MKPAVLLRGFISRMLLGREGWPLVFQSPRAAGVCPSGTSAHLYVHLPYCRTICPHCPYNKELYSPASHAAYASALQRELQAYLARSTVSPIQSIYFGGGTPTLTPDLIELGIEVTRSLYLPGVDIGVEVFPGDADETSLARLRAAGVNRISLGIETFNGVLLQLLGRRYSPARAERAIRTARALGFGCVDVNLIYGIPGQSEAESADDAGRCIDLGVDQVSAYPLFSFAHTPLGRQVSEGTLPVYGDTMRLKAQKLLSRACRDGGLARSSVWSFTRPGVAPYSTVTQEDYVGFGAGAGSKVDGAFWFNTFSVEEYINSAVQRPALVLQASDRFRRLHWFYWQVYRTEIDSRRYRDLFRRELERDFGTLLAILAALGMARRQGGRWRLTESGAVWVHRLQSLFSLSYIDLLWTQCREQAWPEEVVLA